MKRKLRDKFPLAFIAVIGWACSAMVHAQSSGGVYTVRKSVITGGATTQAGQYRLTGTVSQAAAGIASNGSYKINGGFHQAATVGDALFCDGFENTACTSSVAKSQSQQPLPVE